MTTINFHRPFFAVVLSALALLLQSSAAEAARHSCYAPPMVFGPWHVIAAHAGAIKYTIRVTDVVGKTQVVGEVRFFDIHKQRVVRPFFQTTTIECGDCYATVELRAKGVTGTVFTVEVSP